MQADKFFNGPDLAVTHSAHNLRNLARHANLDYAGLTAYMKEWHDWEERKRKQQ